MCLICYRPKGAPAVREEWLLDFQDSNKDGFGIFWVKDGKLVVKRTLAKAEVVPLWREAEQADVEFGAHFRMATHGAVSLENVHPYTVFVEKAGSDVPVSVVAHNGVLSNFGGVRGQGDSDTYYFVYKALAPIAAKFGLKSVYDPESDANFLVETLLGSGNRLLLLDNKLGFCKMGGEWTEWRGLALSNKYAWSYTRRDEEVPAKPAPFCSGMVLEADIERVEIQPDGTRLVAYANGTLISVPPGTPLPKRWVAHQSTSTSSTGPSSTASASGSGSSYASEYGRTYRVAAAFSQSASSNTQPKSEGARSSQQRGKSGQSSTADNSSKKGRAKNKTKRPPKQASFSEQEWEDIYGDALVTQDTYGFLVSLAGQSYSDIFEWVIAEPEAATAVIQELAVSSFKV